MNENGADRHILFKTKLFYMLMSAFFIVFTVLTTVVFLTAFRIQNIEVENCKYSYEENIIKSSGIKTGIHMYAIDKEKIKTAIMSDNPYVYEVRITRKNSKTLCITLSEDEPKFYISSGGKYLVLSDELRVLAEYENENEATALSAAPILLPKVKSASLGKTLVFEEDTEEDGKECIKLLSVLSESDISSSITSADFSERFDIRITYKDKYEIRLGSPQNFAEKIALVSDTVKFLEDPVNGYSTAKGIIHASVNGETSFEATGAIS